jgi:hypothetical protein
MSWIKPGWPLYYTRSTGAESRGVVGGPSPRGADHLAMEYERDGKTVTHDCASLEPEAHALNFEVDPHPKSDSDSDPSTNSSSDGSSSDEGADSDSDSDPESDCQPSSGGESKVAPAREPRKMRLWICVGKSGWRRLGFGVCLQRKVVFDQRFGR